MISESKLVRLYKEDATIYFWLIDHFMPINLKDYVINVHDGVVELLDKEDYKFAVENNLLHKFVPTRFKLENLYESPNKDNKDKEEVKIPTTLIKYLKTLNQTELYGTITINEQCHCCEHESEVYSEDICSKIDFNDKGLSEYLDREIIDVKFEKDSIVITVKDNKGDN